MAAWAALALARFHLALSGADFDQASGSFTSSGKAELARVRRAWEHYLSLKPMRPDAEVAREMVRALGPAGLGSLAPAVVAQEIVVHQDSRSANERARLALLAYLAGQIREGDLASLQAVGLEPKAQRMALKQQLAVAKTQALRTVH